MIGDCAALTIFKTSVHVCKFIKSAALQNFEDGFKEPGDSLLSRSRRRCGLHEKALLNGPFRHLTSPSKSREAQLEGISFELICAAWSGNLSTA